MGKSLSRPKRWSAAVEKARTLLDELENVKAQLAEPMQELEELRQEYEEWKDNLPENLQSSALYEKLDEIAGMDFTEEDDLDTMKDAVEAAESAELPLGFGRD